MHAVLIEVDTSGQPDPEAGLKKVCESRSCLVSARRLDFWLDTG